MQPKKNFIASGANTRESSCAALPLAYHNSSHFQSREQNQESMINRIVSDQFAFSLVILCCFSAFIANIIQSLPDLLPSDQCPLYLASMVGPVTIWNCPFPVINSVLRIALSIYLFFTLLIMLIILTNYTKCSCLAQLSLNQCITWTSRVLSFSNYLCFISLIMDAYSVYTAYSFCQYQLDLTPNKLEINLQMLSNGENCLTKGLISTIVTDIIVILGCSTMKCMIKPFYGITANDSSECIISTSNISTDHPNKIDQFKPTVRSKGVIKSDTGAHDIELKLRDAINQVNYDTESNSADVQDISITQFHSDEKIRITPHKISEIDIDDNGKITRICKLRERNNTGILSVSSPNHYI